MTPMPSEPDPVREDLGPPRRPPRRRRARPPLHRPAPRPRGHVAPGVRRPAARRARACAGPTSPSRRWTTTSRPPASTSRSTDPISAEADGRARAQLRRVRHPPLRDGRSRPGHRARHRARAGAHAAGHDDRVRRQPHLHARRVRRAGVRHRHERGRARARHADAAADASRARWRSPSTATCPPASSAKDIVLAIIARIGTGGGIGSVIEYRGCGDPRAVDGRPHDGLQHVDRGRRAGRARRSRRHDVRVPRRPAVRAARARRGSSALDDWRALVDRRRRGVRQGGRARRGHAAARTCRGARTPARRSRSTTPSPIPDAFADADARESAKRALALHGPEGRHADPRHRRRHRVHRLVHQLAHRRPARRGRRRARAARCKPACARSSCPGSMAVKAQAEAEGLDEVFRAAGFDWREPGCSMCLAMNPDKLAPGERCASTSNRNFEGRQGKGGRTHLVSPAVAAATAIAGHFATPEDLELMEQGRTRDHRARRAAGALRRRHRPDHPERLAQARRAHRASARACSPSGARTPTSCSTRSATTARTILVAGPELRHRLVARARGVGAAWTTASRRCSRRASPTSSATTAGRWASSSVALPAGAVTELWEAIEEDPTLEIVVDVETQAGRGAGDRPRRAVRARRLHAVPPARRPRRHRPHAAPRRRDRRLRVGAACVAATAAVRLDRADCAHAAGSNTSTT